MSRALAERPSVIAGLVRALCHCCAEARALAPSPALDATRLVCPRSSRTYLDRGDGVFEPDGGSLAASTVARGGVSEAPPAAAELLSDRPVRTDTKSRIMLERATFA